MKSVAVFVGIVTGLCVAAWMMGIVGVHYPVVVQDEPLHHPVKVVSVVESRLVLANGQVIAVEGTDKARLDKQLSQSGYEVDVEEESGTGSTGITRIYARQDGWICGTPWAQPIKIRLIPQMVYRNRRQQIGFGEVVKTGM